MLKSALNITLLFVVLVLGNCLSGKAANSKPGDKMPIGKITKSTSHSWTEGIELVFSEDDEVESNYRFKIKNQHRRIFTAFKTSGVSAASLSYPISGIYAQQTASLNENKLCPTHRCPIYLSSNNFRI